MGRPTDYTPQEDAIILATKDAETNTQLQRAGFRQRTPGQIAGRRSYLKNNPGGTQRPGLKLSVLLEQREALRQQAGRTEEALLEVDAELEKALESLQDDMKGGK